MHYFPTLFGKELYMFQTDLLSIVRSLNTVFTVSGVPRNFVRRGDSTNSVEDRGQREWGSESGSPPSQGFWRQL